jgi:hypothetical protein
MCYYCRYLAHEKSINYDDEHYFPEDIKYHSIRSCHLATILRLIGMTIFFVMLNTTIVLSQQSSQIQQQRDQSSSKILERNTQGKKETNQFLLFILVNEILSYI